MLRRISMYLALTVFLGFVACDFGTAVAAKEKVIPVPVERVVNWTLLIYMNGDNDLETQALKDFNEMEAAVSMNSVDVLVLIDRSVGYDSGDGDWSGTRLYRVKKDPDGMNYTIVSQRLAFEGLGLSATGDGDELNLGSSTVLSTFISYGMSHFPAKRTALVIWGHGTGWRGGGSLSAKEFSQGGGGLYKAFSFDDGSDDFLYSSELEDAIEGKNLGIIGFDTCSAMMLEVAYQIREHAVYMIGSEDVISSEGWNYQRIISLLDEGNFTEKELSKLIFDSFELDYANSPGATISVLELGKLAPVKEGLENFVNARIAEAEASGDEAAYYRSLRERILDEVEEFYTIPGDFNIDIGHMAQVFEGDGSGLKAALAEALSYNFASSKGNPNAQGLALHLVPLNELGRTSRHADGYFQDGVVGYSLDFVAGSSWCPNETGKSGLLWKLFY